MMIQKYLNEQQKNLKNCNTNISSQGRRKKFIKGTEKPLTWEDATSAEFSEDVIRAMPVAKNADNNTPKQVPESPAS